jgi:hypothetical protein
MRHLPLDYRAAVFCQINLTLFLFSLVRDNGYYLPIAGILLNIKISRRLKGNMLLNLFLFFDPEST